MKVAVIGAGAWGTTLSILFSEAGNDVTLWVYEDRLCGNMLECRANSQYLPGVQIPINVDMTSNLEEAVKNAELVVFVVPSKFIKRIAEDAAIYMPKNALILSATKGLEDGTGMTMSQVLQKTLPKHSISVLSGPNLSKEISKGQPAACVIASKEINISKKIQSSIILERFRVYTSTDTLGVELGGSLKNIIAIAAGIVDGLGLGDNAKAGLMVRGIVEISRMGVALGASQETFSGLSGMGDLIATCSSKLSRNHKVGEGLAKGRKLQEILAGMKEVAEGVNTTKVAIDISKREQIEMPITQEVYNVLFDGKYPYDAINDLMTRGRKTE